MTTKYQIASLGEKWSKNPSQENEGVLSEVKPINTFYAKPLYNMTTSVRVALSQMEEVVGFEPVISLLIIHTTLDLQELGERLSTLVDGTFEVHSLLQTPITS